MGDRVFIARQDTLEAVQRNTDGEILPALWIAEYKLHGENSYVFRDADVLARMYRSTAAVNDPQINGEALEFVLTHPGAASLSDWLARFSDARAAGQDLFTGLETAAELAENRAAMTALSASETAMTALGESGTAMNAVCSVEMALDKAMKSTHYEKTMREKGMPIAKIVAALAGIEFETISGMAGIVSNSTAMTAIAASGTAMTAIAASATARKKIEQSSVACSALEKVATIVTPTTNPYLYNGKCFVVAISQKWSNGGGAGKQSNVIGNYMDSPTTTTEDTYYNFNSYNKRINRFASSIEIKSSTWGGTATGHWNGAKIVKIR